LKEIVIYLLLAANRITEEGGCILLVATIQLQLKKIKLNRKLVPTEWKGLKLDENQLFMKLKRNGSTKSK
jgi:hypothetical protein